ncbi:MULTISPECIES: hypothetical protein [Clostridium]|nr:MULTISPECIES: hypothetical protein [Clostridium]
MYGKIEITDAVTPITYHGYTDVWKGSYMGWWAKSKHVIPDSNCITIDKF